VYSRYTPGSCSNVCVGLIGQSLRLQASGQEKPIGSAHVVTARECVVDLASEEATFTFTSINECGFRFKEVIEFDIFFLKDVFEEALCT
jgi:hypothetical protein